MALQSCRTGLARSRTVLRSTITRACYSTDTTTTTTINHNTTATASNNATPPPADSNAPRWSQTPVGMKAPIQMDFAKDPDNKIWTSNSNPAVLDEMYNQLLGPGGSRMLPDELKWLAVTHKSFDQGRRGFNDRLALLGRMTLVMETTKDIISQPVMKGTMLQDEFSDRRQVFEHEALSQVDNLNVDGPKDVAGKEKLYALAQNVGMMNVVRWKPRLPRSLKASGVEVVMNSAMLAVIGAITLQHGSVVASKIVRERILARIPRD